MKKALFVAISVCVVLAALTSCVGVSKPSDGSLAVVSAYDGRGPEVMGYGILEAILGQWHGPVMTTTPAGSFPEWYVDFRPVLPGQVSQYSTLDAQTINYLSFFIVERDGKLKVAMRTEGVFQNKGCVTYEVIDRVDEAKGYYRFSDFKSNDERAYTEFRLTGDELVMEVFTNRFNKVSPLEIHTRWKAKRGSRVAADINAAVLRFPQPIVVKDFTDAFVHMSESIYYEFDNDPYPTSPQPFVGSVTVEISIDESLAVEADHELFLLLTTDSLFEGIEYDPDNLKFISRSVYLPVDTNSYTFTNIHPGRYYLYSYNDINGDKYHKSGDYFSSNIENTFTLQPELNITVGTKIDFVIP
jgi:hypothetical protein